ncbi:MAG TPA: hypothetical protein VM221_13145 [Armatimonadota bacterium]|nr:hypothetical protein [Armatimonadota bacterium]
MLSILLDALKTTGGAVAAAVTVVSGAVYLWHVARKYRSLLVFAAACGLSYFVWAIRCTVLSRAPTQENAILRYAASYFAMAVIALLLVAALLVVWGLRSSDKARGLSDTLHVARREHQETTASARESVLEVERLAVREALRQFADSLGAHADTALKGVMVRQACAECDVLNYYFREDGSLCAILHAGEQHNVSPGSLFRVYQRHSVAGLPEPAETEVGRAVVVHVQHKISHAVFDPEATSAAEMDAARRAPIAAPGALQLRRLSHRIARALVPEPLEGLSLDALAALVRVASQLGQRLVGESELDQKEPIDDASYR